MVSGYVTTVPPYTTVGQNVDTPPQQHPFGAFTRPPFMRTHQEPRLYEAEATRRLALRIIIVLASGSFVAACSVGLWFRSTPIVVQRLFVTTIMSGVVFTGAAALLSTLPPHPNDPTQAELLKDDFASKWPRISSTEIFGKYAPILDLNKVPDLLESQLQEFIGRLPPLTQVDNKSEPLRRLLDTVANARAFEDLCGYIPIATLTEYFPATKERNLHLIMAYVWTVKSGCTFESRCSEFTPLFTKNGTNIKADDIFHFYHNLFLDELTTAMNEFNDSPNKLLKLLKYYKERTFQDLPATTKQTLLKTLQGYVYEPWSQDITSSDRRFESSVDMRTEMLQTLRDLPPSRNFDYRRDIDFPLLTKSLLSEHPQVGRIPPATSEECTTFWVMCATDFKSLSPSNQLTDSIKRMLTKIDQDQKAVALIALARSSAVMQSTVMRDIKEFLITTQNTELEGLLSSEDREQLARLKHLSNDDPSRREQVQKFLN